MFKKNYFFTGKKIKSLALVLALCGACLTVSATDALSVSAAVTAESIKEKENQISDAKAERDAMKSNLTDLKKLQDELKASKNDLNAYVQQLDASLSSIQANIDELNDKITEKENEIEETEQELEEAQKQQEDQYESMKERIRFMYERGDQAYLEMLIESGSFNEMLNKAEYIENLSQYDRNKLEEYITTTKMVKLTKEALEEEKITLDEAKADLAAEEASMQALINDKTSEINSLSADINNKEAAIKEYEASIAEQNSTIAELEKIVAEEKKQLEAQNKQARVYNGGMFTWPCPSYTRISDDYGNRMHPTLGVVKFHAGVDMAAPGGSSILAAYDGTVVAAAYSSSMGNYVMIDHGSGLYTVYMHASALYVSKGQEVSKGATIAAVGSTGRSTGNHLHFAVRLNGSYVNPWNYLKS